MSHLINKMITRILTSFLCCFFLVNIGYVFSSIKSEKKYFSQPGNYRHFSTDLPDLFRAPSDIALDSGGNLAMIVNTEYNTTPAVGIITRCNVNEGKWFSACGYDIQAWKPDELKYGFNALAFGPTDTFVFATSNYNIADFNALWRCRVSRGGFIADCQSDSGYYAQHFNGSNDIVISSKGDFAYVVNHKLYFTESTPSFKISRCRLNPLKWIFSDCTEMEIPDLDYPTGITLNASGTLAFITNNGFSVNGNFSNANAVIRCHVNVVSGEFTDCRNTGGTGFSTPQRLVLNKEGTRAFVASSGSNDIIRCAVDISGNFSDCKATGTGFHNPSSIVLNKSNTTAFITNSANNTVSRCFINEDGNFSACRNAFSLDLAISVLDDKGHAVSFLNLPNMTNTPVLTIKNSGFILKNFHLNADAVPYVSLDTSCSNGLFAAKSTCQLHFRKDAPVKEGNAGFTVKLFNGDDLLEEFFTGVSGVKVRADAWPVTSLNAGQGAVGKLEFTTDNEVKDVSFHFSNPQMAQFFHGECLNTSSLKADGSCSLEYSITENAINGKIEGFITVNQGVNTIYRLPVSVSSNPILKVTNAALTRYNTTKITLSNVSDKPLTHLYFFNFNTGVKLIKDDCHGSIDAEKSCDLSYFTDVDQSVTSDSLRIQAVGIMSPNIKLPISKVPESTVNVKNMGGYVMRTYYPKLNADGSIGIGKTGDMLRNKSKTIKVATFNDPDNLPDSLTSVKNIKLDIVASTINRYLPACDGGYIRCTRATVNARCYYTNRTIRKDGHGCIE